MIAINDTPVDSLTDMQCLISEAKHRGEKHMTSQAIPVARINLKPDSGIPQILFDQMHVIATQYHAEKFDLEPWMEPEVFLTV